MDPSTLVAVEPALLIAQVERLRGLVLEEVPVGVDGELQIVLFDRAPDRLAVEVDEHRRRLAEKDRRRIRLEAGNVLGLDRALVDEREHAIERDDAIVFGNRPGDLGDGLLQVLLRQVREIRLGDAHVGEAHQPLVERHARLALRS